MDALTLPGCPCPCLCQGPISQFSELGEYLISIDATGSLNLDRNAWSPILPAEKKVLHTFAMSTAVPSAAHDWDFDQHHEWQPAVVTDDQRPAGSLRSRESSRRHYELGVFGELFWISLPFSLPVTVTPLLAIDVVDGIVQFHGTADYTGRVAGAPTIVTGPTGLQDAILFAGRRDALFVDSDDARTTLAGRRAPTSWTVDCHFKTPLPSTNQQAYFTLVINPQLFHTGDQTPQGHCPCSWPPRGHGHGRLLRLPASKGARGLLSAMWGLLTCASLLLPPLQVHGHAGGDITINAKNMLGYMDMTNKEFVSSGFSVAALAVGWHRLTVSSCTGEIVFFIDGVESGSVLVLAVSDFRSIGNIANEGWLSPSNQPFAHMWQFRLWGECLVDCVEGAEPRCKLRTNQERTNQVRVGPDAMIYLNDKDRFSQQPLDSAGDRWQDSTASYGDFAALPSLVPDVHMIGDETARNTMVSTQGARFFSEHFCVGWSQFVQIDCADCEACGRAPGCDDATATPRGNAVFDGGSDMCKQQSPESSISF